MVLKRIIRLVFNDDSEPIDLVISKAASVKSEQKMINLDQLKDGSWRLIYNEDLIPDFSKIEKLEIIREYNSDTVTAIEESYSKDIPAIDGETYLSIVKERRKTLEKG